MSSHCLLISAAIILVARIKAKVFLVRVAIASFITLANPRYRKWVTKITNSLKHTVEKYLMLMLTIHTPTKRRYSIKITISSATLLF